MVFFNKRKASSEKFPSDNWIYIQDPAVKVGRLQIYNNWSPYLVKESNTIWLGMEYFVNETDEWWQRSDEDLTQFALEELSQLGIANKEAVLDTTLIRVPMPILPILARILSLM